MTLSRADSSRITPESRQRVLKAYHLTTDAEPLAFGTEAEVYAYDSESVLKIYADTSRLSYFETLRNFYATIDTSATTLTLPRIREITRHSDLIAVIESRVAGVSLEERLPILDTAQHEKVEKLYLDTAFQLRYLIIQDQPKTYFLFDQDLVSLREKQSFNSFYAQFLMQKVEHVGKYFAPAYPGFEEKAHQLVTMIQNSTPERLSVVHGDFFPGNVLVSADLNQVYGVIDFGSFTLIGDYLLDIAGAFGFYRMYEPNRIDIRRGMLPKILNRLQENEYAAFFQYLLAHAILTSDLYASDPDPTEDEHFQWATEIISDNSYWQGALG